MFETSAKGIPPRNPKFYAGAIKLNKVETKAAWDEFDGDTKAEMVDGCLCVTRTISRKSKGFGVAIRYTESLLKQDDGYGTLEFRVDVGAVPKRKSAAVAFNEVWEPLILDAVRSVVVDGQSVAETANKLSDTAGMSFSTARANIWVADKWSRGESTSFLPHRAMIRPVFDLLCELGKRDCVLASLKAYCAEVTTPSQYVQDILMEQDS